MKKTIPFNPMPFPIIDAEWQNRLTPHVQAFLKTHHAFDKARQRDGVGRLIKWQRRQGKMLRQAQEELWEAQLDLSVRLCCRDVLAAATELGVTPALLWTVFTICTNQSYGGVLRTDDDKFRWWRWHFGMLDGTEAMHMSRQLQDILFGTASSSLQSRRITPAIRHSLTWLAEWVADADDERLRVIFADHHDREVLDAIEQGASPDSPISIDGAEQQRRRTAALGTECDGLRRALEQVSTRMRRMRDHIVAPLNEVLEAEEELGFPALLCFTFTVDVHRALGPTLEQEQAEQGVLLHKYAFYLMCGCADPLFWYVGLTSLLQQSGALIGDTLKGWAVDLLSQTIAHPAKVKRMDVPMDAIRTRSVLSKLIAPMLIGYHPDDGLAERLQAAGHAQPLEVLQLLSTHLAGLIRHQDGTFGYRNKPHEQAVKELWLTAVGPNSRHILLWMADGLKTPEQRQAFLDSQPEPAEEWPQPLDMDAAKEAVDDRETWFYVPNPRSAVPKLVPIELAGEQRNELFEQFLRDQRVKVVVKSASIVGALEYFRDMPDVIRNQTRYDDLNGQRWHKLKRGTQRIYVRLEPDGRLLFHPYARKEWKPDWVDYAA